MYSEYPLLRMNEDRDTLKLWWSSAFNLLSLWRQQDRGFLKLQDHAYLDSIHRPHNKTTQQFSSNNVVHTVTLLQCNVKTTKGHLKKDKWRVVTKPTMMKPMTRRVCSVTIWRRWPYLLTQAITVPWLLLLGPLDMSNGVTLCSTGSTDPHVHNNVGHDTGNNPTCEIKTLCFEVHLVESPRKVNFWVNLTSPIPTTGPDNSCM